MAASDRSLLIKYQDRTFLLVARYRESPHWEWQVEIQEQGGSKFTVDDFASSLTPANALALATEKVIDLLEDKQMGT